MSSTENDVVYLFRMYIYFKFGKIIPKLNENSNQRRRRLKIGNGEFLMPSFSSKKS